MSIEVRCTRKQAGIMHFLIESGLMNIDEETAEDIKTNIEDGKFDIHYSFTDEVIPQEEKNEIEIEEEYQVIENEEENVKMNENNVIIGLGNCGTQIVKRVANNSALSNDDSVKLFAIDSTITSVDLDTISKMEFIPIISDEKSGSGRNRERGNAMYKYHEENHEFDNMYATAINAKAPVIVITSSVGGTGSGSVVPLCEALVMRGVHVIPIIVCPNMSDPDAYHLNTNDLMVELNDVGIETYSVFRNSRGDADYTPINDEIVQLIEIILGKKYDNTNLDSIDDSDLDVILNTPGRFIAVDITSDNVDLLKKELTRKVFSGYQPAWSNEDAKSHTFMTAFSLTSMFAKQDFKEVFAEVNNRIVNVFDEYRNIVDDDNNGKAHATLIVAGLPRQEIKMIDTEYKEPESIGKGVNRSRRPSFLNKKKAVITPSVESAKTKDGNDSVINKFGWK